MGSITDLAVDRHLVAPEQPHLERDDNGENKRNDNPQRYEAEFHEGSRSQLPPVLSVEIFHRPWRV